MLVMQKENNGDRKFGEGDIFTSRNLFIGLHASEYMKVVISVEFVVGLKSAMSRTLRKKCFSKREQMRERGVEHTLDEVADKIREEKLSKVNK